MVQFAAKSIYAHKLLIGKIGSDNSQEADVCDEEED
jgi:hypothetical protein